MTNGNDRVLLDWTPKTKKAKRLWNKLIKDYQIGRFYRFKTAKNIRLLERTGIMEKLMILEYQYYLRNPLKRRLKRLNVKQWTIPPSGSWPYGLDTIPPKVGAKPTIPSPKSIVLKGSLMERSRKHVPPRYRPHKAGVPAPYKHVGRHAAGGGTSAQPFNWKSNAVPPKSLQRIFRADRPGQPGWGMDINRSRPVPNTLRQRRAPHKGASYSLLNPIKVADWQLQSMREPHKRRTGSSNPFMSVIDQLKGMEKRAEARIVEQRRTNKLMKRFERSISKPQPFNAHEQMRRKYGAKIDAIAKSTPKFTPKTASMSAGDWTRLHRIFGAHPGATGPSMNRIRFGQPSLGMEINRYRPAPNTLSYIGRGLGNPNRARPMHGPIHGPMHGPMGR